MLFAIQATITCYYSDDATAFDGTLPESYNELPLIGRDLNSVDFFAQFLWHSYDPEKWASREAGAPCASFIPGYRRELIARAEVHPQ